MSGWEKRWSGEAGFLKFNASEIQWRMESEMNKMQPAVTCRCENQGVDIYIFMCVYIYICKILTFWLTIPCLPIDLALLSRKRSVMVWGKSCIEAPLRNVKSRVRWVRNSLSRLCKYFSHLYCVISGGNFTCNSSRLDNWDNLVSLMDTVEEIMHEKC